MSLTAKIQKFFGILSDCFVMRVPDAYEQEKCRRTGEMKYRIPGNIVAGEYGG
jgi:hypothetical protein